MIDPNGNNPPNIRTICVRRDTILALLDWAEAHGCGISQAADAVIQRALLDVRDEAVKRLIAPNTARKGG